MDGKTVTMRKVSYLCHTWTHLARKQGRPALRTITQTLHSQKVFTGKMTDANHSLPQHEELKTRIMEVAIKAFHSKGIKDVTMDDVARLMKMSKRTLYQVFADKEELLLACVQAHDAKETVRMDEIHQHADNVLDFLLRIFVLKLQELDGIKPRFFVEITKYPKVMEFFDRNKEERENEAVKFLEQGIEQGYFIETVNFRIIYRHLTSLMPFIVENELWKEFTKAEVFVNTVLPIFRGVATKKGIEIIDHFLDKTDEEYYDQEN